MLTCKSLHILIIAQSPDERGLPRPLRLRAFGVHSTPDTFPRLEQTFGALFSYMFCSIILEVKVEMRLCLSRRIWQQMQLTQAMLVRLSPNVRPKKCKVLFAQTVVVFFCDALYLLFLHVKPTNLIG